MDTLLLTNPESKGEVGERVKPRAQYLHEAIAVPSREVALEVCAWHIHRAGFDTAAFDALDSARATRRKDAALRERFDFLCMTSRKCREQASAVFPWAQLGLIYACLAAVLLEEIRERRARRSPLKEEA